MASAAKKLAAVPPVKRGRPPINFTPAHGEIIAEPEGVQFGNRSGRVSYYAEMLQKLFDAGPGQVLKFDSAKGRGAIIARARKLGYRVLLGEATGALYVKIVGVDVKAAKGGSAPFPTVTLSAAVLAVVREAPRTNAEVFDHVRVLLPEAVRASVDATLSILRGKGEIAKRDDMKWYPVKGGTK